MDTGVCHMDLHELSAMLSDRRLSVVSRATGIHRNTLSKIRDGMVADIKLSTAKLLMEYFDENDITK